MLDVAATLADDHPRRRVRHDHLDDDDGDDDGDDDCDDDVDCDDGDDDDK